jgi:hypothetical protein
MAISGLSTLGVTVWQAEAADNAKVTEASSYSRLTRINEIGEADVSPEAIDSSALEDLVTKYVPGRSSVTDSIPFTVNATNETIAEWTAILGKTVCILVDVPGLDKQWFVIVTVPNILPMPSMGQNNLLTMVVNCTVNDFIGLSERVVVDTSAVVQDEE